ncbi:MAG: HAD-IA family hydrolase [Lachnospiraceae bacterium]|nr:HAD-IA family hydrolase [Lachnospiraceae bacterium]
MRYKNIIFDIGGVLLSYRWLDLVRETQPDEEKAKAFADRLFHDPLWLQFDIGIRLFDDIVEEYARKYPEDEKHIRYVLGHLERMPLPRPRVWEKVHELKKAGYHLYMLSNYSDRMFHVHTDGLPFHDDMEGRIISYEVHHIKPDKEIYEDLFKRYSLNPAECLFFDDRQENVDGGRKCGMEGRVIYSEEVLIGYLDRLLADDGISNRFHDYNLSREDRIAWLISEMTTEEKISLYSYPEKGVGRLGVEGFVLGGEAAHGVEARNKDNGILEPDTTTSFPNPIGMSAAWDPGLMYKVGETVGTEARACWKKHRKTGLSRWAPTVDMERDPRWGRNEEGYGEDPLLTSGNTAAYIEGMKGMDPDYIKCGATIKHYYANNSEKDRFFSNSSVGIRDKYEYYLPSFKKVIAEAGALGVMTAYNKVNGIPAMLDPEVKTLLKDKYGLTHAVCDGFAMVRLQNFHHEFGTLAECAASSVKSGVDWMNDLSCYIEKAIKDALNLEILSEEELDRALKNILMTGMKLGVYDPEEILPFKNISMYDTDTKEARDICLKMTEESLILLENKNDILPLNKDQAGKILLAGPLSDEWHKDWYIGQAPFGHNVREGLSELLKKEIPTVKGLDKYKIILKDKAWQIDKENNVVMGPVEEGDEFYVEDRGESYFTIRSVRTGKYIQAAFYDAKEGEKETLKADREDVFDWLVTGRFSIKEVSNTKIEIKNRFGNPVGVTPEGKLKADDKTDGAEFSLEKVFDGAGEIIKAAKDKDIIILVLGCDPMIPAREDFDRRSLALPAGQQRLLNTIVNSGKKVITVLITNYPYTFDGAEKKTDALLLSASGSEYMGDAIASAIFGESAPAGRLSQSWPVSEDILPDITDYRIIGKRTYRYISEGWLYPFGYGLSYGDIEYTEMSVISETEDHFEVSITLYNKGSRATDEVIQLYAKADIKDERMTRAGYGRRLIAFRREKEIRPNEKRSVNIIVKKESLNIYDAVRSGYIIHSGSYHLYAGRDSMKEAVSCRMQIKGSEFAKRDLSVIIPVYSCDDEEGIEFTKGHFGMTAAQSEYPFEDDKRSILKFAKCLMPEGAKNISLILKSDSYGAVEVYWEEKMITKWSGNTSSFEKELTAYELPSEDTVMPETWPALWSEESCKIQTEGKLNSDGKLQLILKGDVKLLSVTAS